MVTSSDVYTHHNRRRRSRPAQYHMEMSISNILRDKSFVDDLNKRVAARLTMHYIGSLTQLSHKNV
jgi:hypothetical protein